MKIYIGNKKENDRAVYGITIYNNKGAVLHSSKSYDDVSPNKFENSLKALLWGIVKFKALTQNKTLSESEDVILVTGSKTIYNWIEKEVAPEPYTTLMSDIFMEAAFLMNNVEVIHSASGGTKVLYKNSVVDKGTKITDLFSGK